MMMSVKELEEDPHFRDLKNLGDRFNLEYQHSVQVCRLALAIYDELQQVHGLPDRDRTLLMAASFLHDIGAFGPNSRILKDGKVVHGVHEYKHHHKRSQRILLDEGAPDLTEAEVRLVSCVARYHTHSVPKAHHPVYRDLPKRDKRRVRLLSAILRVADSLDRRHASMARDLRCHLSEDGRMLTIWLFCRKHDFDWRPKHRTDLFEDEFKVEVKVPVLFGARVG